MANKTKKAAAKKADTPIPEFPKRKEVVQPQATAATTAKRVPNFTPLDPTKQRKKPKSMAQKASLVMPVFRIYKQLKHFSSYKKGKISKGAAVYMAAALEYLVAEVLELGGVAATDNKKKRIIPRHLQLAIRNDSELNELLKDVTMSQGGVVPFIHAILLPKATKEKKKRQSLGSEDMDITGNAP